MNSKDRFGLRQRQITLRGLMADRFPAVSPIGEVLTIVTAVARALDRCPSAWTATSRCQNRQHHADQSRGW